MISIEYKVSSSYDRSRLRRQLDEMGPAFIIGVIAVTGVALLTALYFGIMCFAFLWLRKIAIRRGLLKRS